MNRDDLAWKIISFTARHIASDTWSDRFFLKQNQKSNHEKVARSKRLFPAGHFVTQECKRCRVTFTREITVAGSRPALYCSLACRKALSAINNRNRKNPRPCPTPEKTTFKSHPSAQKYLRLASDDNPEMWDNLVYACRCGGYHLGRKDFTVSEFDPRTEEEILKTLKDWSENR